MAEAKAKQKALLRATNTGFQCPAPPPKTRENQLKWSNSDTRAATARLRKRKYDIHYGDGRRPDGTSQSQIYGDSVFKSRDLVTNPTANFITTESAEEQLSEVRAELRHLMSMSPVNPPTAMQRYLGLKYLQPRLVDVQEVLRDMTANESAFLLRHTESDGNATPLCTAIACDALKSTVDSLDTTIGMVREMRSELLAAIYIDYKDDENNKGNPAHYAKFVPYYEENKILQQKLEHMTARCAAAEERSANPSASILASFITLPPDTQRTLMKFMLRESNVDATQLLDRISDEQRRSMLRSQLQLMGVEDRRAGDQAHSNALSHHEEKLAARESAIAVMGQVPKGHSGERASTPEAPVRVSRVQPELFGPMMAALGAADQRALLRGLGQLEARNCETTQDRAELSIACVQGVMAEAEPEARRATLQTLAKRGSESRDMLMLHLARSMDLGDYSFLLNGLTLEEAQGLLKRQPQLAQLFHASPSASPDPQPEGVEPSMGTADASPSTPPSSPHHQRRRGSALSHSVRAGFEAGAPVAAAKRAAASLKTALAQLPESLTLGAICGLVADLQPDELKQLMSKLPPSTRSLLLACALTPDGGPGIVDHLTELAPELTGGLTAQGRSRVLRRLLASDRRSVGLTDMEAVADAVGGGMDKEQLTRVLRHLLRRRIRDDAVAELSELAPQLAGGMSPLELNEVFLHVAELMEQQVEDVSAGSRSARLQMLQLLLRDGTKGAEEEEKGTGGEGSHFGGGRRRTAARLARSRNVSASRARKKEKERAAQGPEVVLDLADHASFLISGMTHEKRRVVALRLLSSCAQKGRKGDAYWLRTRIKELGVVEQTSASTQVDMALVRHIATSDQRADTASVGVSTSLTSVLAAAANAVATVASGIEGSPGDGGTTSLTSSSSAEVEEKTGDASPTTTTTAAAAAAADGRDTTSGDGPLNAEDKENESATTSTPATTEGTGTGPEAATSTSPVGEEVASAAGVQARSYLQKSCPELAFEVGELLDEGGMNELVAQIYHAKLHEDVEAAKYSLPPIPFPTFVNSFFMRKCGGVRSRALTEIHNLQASIQALDEDRYIDPAPRVRAFARLAGLKQCCRGSLLDCRHPDPYDADSTLVWFSVLSDVFPDHAGFADRLGPYGMGCYVLREAVEKAIFSRYPGQMIRPAMDTFLCILEENAKNVPFDTDKDEPRQQLDWDLVSEPILDCVIAAEHHVGGHKETRVVTALQAYFRGRQCRRTLARQLRWNLRTVEEKTLGKLFDAQVQANAEVLAGTDSEERKKELKRAYGSALTPRPVVIDTDRVRALDATPFSLSDFWKMLRSMLPDVLLREAQDLYDLMAVNTIRMHYGEPMLMGTGLSNPQAQLQLHHERLAEDAAAEAAVRDSIQKVPSKGAGETEKGTIQGTGDTAGTKVLTPEEGKVQIRSHSSRSFRARAVIRRRQRRSLARVQRAMATAGCLVLATRRGGMREEVSVSRMSGVTDDGSDSSSLEEEYDEEESEIATLQGATDSDGVATLKDDGIQTGRGKGQPMCFQTLGAAVSKRAFVWTLLGEGYRRLTSGRWQRPNSGKYGGVTRVEQALAADRVEQEVIAKKLKAERREKKKARLRRAERREARKQKLLSGTAVDIEQSHDGSSKELSDLSSLSSSLSDNSDHDSGGGTPSDGKMGTPLEMPELSESRRPAPPPPPSSKPM